MQYTANWCPTCDACSPIITWPAIHGSMVGHQVQRVPSFQGWKWTLQRNLLIQEPALSHEESGTDPGLHNDLISRDVQILLDGGLVAARLNSSAHNDTSPWFPWRMNWEGSCCMKFAILVIPPPASGGPCNQVF